MGNRRMISCFRIILLLLGAFSPVIKANGVEDIPAQVLASWLFVKYLTTTVDFRHYI